MYAKGPVVPEYNLAPKHVFRHTHHYVRDA